jgi:hypothetical protein
VADLSSYEKRTIKSIMPTQGCLRQSWVIRKSDGQGESIDAHRPVIGLALLDDGTLDLIIVFSGEVTLRADVEAWAENNPQIAPDRIGERSTLYESACECGGRTVKREELTADEVTEAFDLAAEPRPHKLDLCRDSDPRIRRPAVFRSLARL